MNDTPVVFSRRQVEPFTPEGSPRTYHIAPLSYREMQAFRAAVTREAGLRPADGELHRALRAAMREIAPANLDEVLAIIDAQEADHETAGADKDFKPDPDVAARYAQVAIAGMSVPVYADLRAAEQNYIGMIPWVSAAHGLRGWDGPDLPEFRRVRGVVPPALLDELPPDEVAIVGWRAWGLTNLPKVAEGNSEAPSPAPSTQPDTEAA